MAFEADERHIWAAAIILEHFGIIRVRLLTSNLPKLEQLAAFGINVIGPVPYGFEPNPHNKAYLLTIALQSGNLIEVDRVWAAILAAPLGPLARDNSANHGHV